jgi:hypothetical protein
MNKCKVQKHDVEHAAAHSSRSVSLPAMVQRVIQAGVVLAQQLGLLSSSTSNTSRSSPEAQTSSRKRKADDAFKDDIDEHSIQALLSLQRPLAEQVLRSPMCGGLAKLLQCLPRNVHPLVISAYSESDYDGALSLVLDASAQTDLRSLLPQIASAAEQMDPPIESLLANGFQDASAHFSASDCRKLCFFVLTSDLFALHHESLLPMKSALLPRSKKVQGLIKY